MQVIIEKQNKKKTTYLKMVYTCADPESFVRWGPTLTFYFSFLFFFFFDEGRYDSNTTISGPSTARQRNAIQMTFRWRADGGPTLNAGL